MNPFPQILKIEYVYKEEKRQGIVKSLLFKFHVFNVDVFLFWKVNIYDCILLKQEQLRKAGTLTRYKVLICYLNPRNRLKFNKSYIFNILFHYIPQQSECK